MTWRHTVVLPEPTSPVSSPMPRSSMRCWRRASASRRELDSNSSSLEGEPGAGEVTQVHYLFSLSLRIASGEGGGSGGGLSHWSCQEGRWRLTVVLA